MNKAAFLDRDGTIIYDVHYLARLEDCRLLPGIVELLRKLQAAGYLLIVVTNQSGVARGFFDEAFVEKTHEHLRQMLAPHGITITAFYYCAHHPHTGTRKDLIKTCTCRKPMPGMLEQAAAAYDIELSASLMIGNEPYDLAAGKAAGCRAYHINEALAGAITDI